MRDPGSILLALPVCLIILAVSGCPQDGDSQGGPAILGEEHLGRKNQHCDVCHSPLPLEDHTVSDTSACAGCHGGNGACDPNGEQNATRQHDAELDDCVACHVSNHQYTLNTECISCHFAAQGLDPTCGIEPPNDGGDGGVDGSDGGVDGGDGGVDAGDGGVDGGSDAGDSGGGPILSNALESNCYNWPAQQFSASNHAGVGTGLAGGAMAVELELLDTDGQPHSLSELLITKPVLLVFGAFT